MTTAPLASLRRTGRIVGWVLLALLVLAVAGAAWIGVRGVSAFAHLQQARADITRAADNITDPAAAATHIASANAQARTAEDLTSDPVWWLGEQLPWVGPQLHAVSALSAAASDITGTALAPLAELSSTFSLDAFRIDDGALNLEAFAAIHQPAAEAAAGLDDARAELALDPAPLLAPVREGLYDAVDQVAVAADAAGAVERATALLPTMLGADQPRTWLLLFQNNAEMRSLGGMPGATAIVSADGGRIELASQGTALMPRFDEPVLPLDPDVEALYGTRPAVWFSGTTLHPDFAQAAPLAREMWRLEHGVETDGVISMDPVALSYLLEATGPVTIPSGETLTPDNAVDFLLNQVYLDYPNSAEENAVFAGAAASVFSALTSGDVNPTALIAALAHAGDERRLLLWSSDESEQARIAETTLAGHLPISDRHTARFGVYLNDGTGSKLGPYIDVEPTMQCAGGEATLSLTLHSRVPADAATSLPGAIAGGAYGVPKGVLRVVGYIYLPVGSTLVDASVTHAPGFGGGFHGNYQVLSYATDLAPGDTSVATLTVALPTPVAASATADLTPGFGPTSVSAPCE